MLPLFLGCFSSNLFILAEKRICMKARRNSKLGQILPPTAELAALERQKNPHRLIMGKPVLPLILGCFDRILCILADNDDMKSSKFGQS